MLRIRPVGDGADPASDLEAIAGAPTLCCESVYPSASVEDLFAIVRKRKKPEEGEHDTRLYVLERMDCVEDAGEKVAVNWVCGGFAYELQDDLYGLLFLRLHPSIPREEALPFVAGFLKGKAAKSVRRREVRAWLRDDDSLADLAPLWQGAGFSLKLQPDWFASGGPDASGELEASDGVKVRDGWLTTYVAPRYASAKS